MREDDLFDLLDGILSPLGSMREDGEEYREPVLDVLAYYRRAVRIQPVPILGRGLSVVVVARQPRDVDHVGEYATLLDRLRRATNGRFPPWGRPGGLTIGLTAVMLTPEPIGPGDDEALGTALKSKATSRVVPLGLVRLNLGQEALSYALAGGPPGVFPEPEAIVDGLTPHLKRFVPFLAD